MEIIFAVGGEYLKLAWENRHFPKLRKLYLWAFFALFIIDSLDGN